ncbi:RNA methyltransferase [Candidatus Uhrbacteria bacterium]|nr:RNA methyltransferase [Candidatus Uhrbacteria bacterium]
MSRGIMHKGAVYLVADRIRSLHNVGSLFRSADAFGVAKVYLCGYTGTPPRKEIAKVALGAEQTVPWEKRGQTWKVVEELQAQGVQVVALEQTKKSQSIKKFKPRFPVAIVVGNEVNGVSRGVLERADAIVHIPMLGKKESLNVSVAAGVALYALRHVTDSRG